MSSAGCCPGARDRAHELVVGAFEKAAEVVVGLADEEDVRRGGLVGLLGVAPPVEEERVVAAELRVVLLRPLGAVDLVVDGGELPGTPSTVIDLSGYEETAGYSIAREGALDAGSVRVALG